MKITKTQHLSWSGWIEHCSWYLCMNVTIAHSVTVIYLISQLHDHDFCHHLRTLGTARTLVRLVTASTRTSNNDEQENDQGSDKEHANGRNHEYVRQRRLDFGREVCLLRARGVFPSRMSGRCVQVLCVSSIIWREMMVRKISWLHTCVILCNKLRV